VLDEDRAFHFDSGISLSVAKALRTGASNAVAITTATKLPSERIVIHIGLMRLRQTSRVIKLPQLLDFVRPTNQCRIFAVLQINHSLELLIFGVVANRIGK
jgi:hypothetical protein